jgi:hypothetical protein
MKSKFFLFAFILILLACQEDPTHAIPIDPPLDEPHDPPPGQDWRVKSIISHEGIVTTYFYDDLHRLIDIQNNVGYHSTFEYHEDSIVQAVYNEFGEDIHHYLYCKLNEKGLVERVTRSDNSSYHSNKFYDADLHLIKEITTHHQNTFQNDYFYSQGNLDSVRYNQDGVWKYSYIYQQWDDILNNLTYGLHGQPYFGNESKNLFKSWTSRTPSHVENTSSSSYTFDSLGRVDVKTNMYNDQKSTFTYTYY